MLNLGEVRETILLLMSILLLWSSLAKDGRDIPHSKQDSKRLDTTVRILRRSVFQNFTKVSDCLNKDLENLLHHLTPLRM